MLRLDFELFWCLLIHVQREAALDQKVHIMSHCSRTVSLFTHWPRLLPHWLSWFIHVGLRLFTHLLILFTHRLRLFALWFRRITHWLRLLTRLYLWLMHCFRLIALWRSGCSRTSSGCSRSGSALHQ